MKALHAVVLLSLVPVIGCGERADAESTQDVSRQVTSSLEEVVDVLDDVIEGASVESAKMKFEEIVGRFEVLAARMEEFDAATLEQIKTDVEGAVQALGARMIGIAAKALSDPRLLELRPAVQDILKALPIVGS